LFSFFLVYSTPSDLVPMIDKETLVKRMESEEPYLLIDVREPNELVSFLLFFIIFI
jgi:hypothetical protein